MYMHLAQDPIALKKAIKRGVPFGRTVCGRTLSRIKLVEDPRAVQCPSCLDQIAVPESVALDNEEMDADISEGLDELGELDLDLPFSMDFGFTPVAESELVEEKRVVEVVEHRTEEPESDPLEFVAAVMGALVPDDFVPDPLWSRWLVSLKNDSKGALTAPGLAEGKDLREIIPLEDVKFLRELSDLAQTINVEPLSSKLLTVIHHLACRIAAAEGGHKEPVEK